MKLAFTLAYKNLISAGLRTWLNAIVLSFTFVLILFFNGIMEGWSRQARQDNIEWEEGQGQLQQKDYDPFDPFTIQDSHDKIPDAIRQEITPILLRQGTIYPQGRVYPIVLKGIAAKQSTLAIPTAEFKRVKVGIPAIIGNRTAKLANLKEGDQVLLQWRDKNGTFDAQNITIAYVFSTNVSTVDNGQIWLPIDHLWRMTGLDDEATLLVAQQPKRYEAEGWTYKSQKELLKDFDDIIATEWTSSAIMYVLFLAIALLAIFDTQVLSIFRRQKEIGTFVALGMTRWSVVALFTLEGTMYSFFAILLGVVYGTPLLYYLSIKGMGMPETVEDLGVTMASRIYPVYGAPLVIGTVIVIVVSAAIVSFLPARKIAKINPILAIKGKIQ